MSQPASFTPPLCAPLRIPLEEFRLICTFTESRRITCRNERRGRKSDASRTCSTDQLSIRVSTHAQAIAARATNIKPTLELTESRRISERFSLSANRKYKIRRRKFPIVCVERDRLQSFTMGKELLLKDISFAKQACVGNPAEYGVAAHSQQFKLKRTASDSTEQHQHQRRWRRQRRPTHAPR